MPVIINELEVIAQPPTPESAQPTAPQGETPSGPRPADIHRVVQKFMERRYRLWAR